MGAIGGLLGTDGGAAGSGFAAPAGSPIIAPTDTGQLSNSYGGVQSSLAQQQALLQALQGQNGLSNQSQIYGQLQGVANGTGPNPAQAMLNQATGANVANQAALMAGQRGSGANAGLIARQSANQGANIQQQAIGQGATMQAQQSLGALSAAGDMANNQASNQIGQTNAISSAQMGEQGNLLNAMGGYNNAVVGMQSNLNNANAGLAQTQMSGQHSMLGGLGFGGGSLMGGMKASGGLVENFASGGQASAFNSPQGQFGQFVNIGGGSNSAPNIGSPGSGLSAGVGGGGSQGPGAAGAAMHQALSNGIKKLFTQSPSAGPSAESQMGVIDSGTGAADLGTTVTAPAAADAGAVAEGVTGGTELAAAAAAPEAAGLGSTIAELAPLAAAAAKGGKIKHSTPNHMLAMTPSGPTPMKPMDTSKPIKNLKGGGHVAGKPKVKGNNLKNDTVPAMLSPGEVVIPNSVMQSSDPVRHAAAFVQSVLAKKKLGK